MTAIVVWGSTAVIAGIIGFFLASVKNRDPSAWAAWCFVLPPLVLVMLLLSKNTGPRRRQMSLDEQDKEVF